MLGDERTDVLLSADFAGKHVANDEGPDIRNPSVGHSGAGCFRAKLSEGSFPVLSHRRLTDPDDVDLSHVLPPSYSPTASFFRCRAYIA